MRDFAACTHRTPRNTWPWCTSEKNIPHIPKCWGFILKIQNPYALFVKHHFCVNRPNNTSCLHMRLIDIKSGRLSHQPNGGETLLQGHLTQVHLAYVYLESLTQMSLGKLIADCEWRIFIHCIENKCSLRFWVWIDMNIAFYPGVHRINHLDKGLC